MSTSVSFTLTAKETVRKAFTGVKQHPELPKTTTASGKDVQFMEHSWKYKWSLLYNSISQQVIPLYKAKKKKKRIVHKTDA